MAFSDFIACCSTKSQAFGEALVNVGEDAVRSLLSVWRTLPAESKTAILVAAEAGATVLAGALAAVGIEASEALAAFLIGFGIGAAIAIMLDCGDCLGARALQQPRAL
jgi:urease accessory protein UreF